MFPYTVRRDNYLITAVDRVSAVEDIRPIPERWVEQPSFNVLLQRSYRTRKVSGGKRWDLDDAEAAAAPQESERHIDAFLMRDSLLFLLLHTPMDRVSPDFITKRANDLMRYL